MTEKHFDFSPNNEKAKFLMDKVNKEYNSYQTHETNDLNKIINYIEENLVINQEDDIDVLSISKIADLFNLSTSALNELFNNGCPVTLHDYIIKRRMTLASHDLIESNDSIMTISQRYGYNSPDSFTRIFKKTYGLTPTEYRKNGILKEDFNRFYLRIYDLNDLYLVEKNCRTCEFCMPGNNTLVCAGRNEEYGFSIKEMIEKYPNGCDCFNYSLDAFIENEQKKEKLIKEIIDEKE